MTRLVVMVFSNDGVCFPSRPPVRLVKAGGVVATADGGPGPMIDGLIRFLEEHGVRVEDVEEADGEGCHAVVLLARPGSPEPSVGLLRERLRAYGQSAGLTIRVQREDLFLSMHRI